MGDSPVNDVWSGWVLDPRDQDKGSLDNREHPRTDPRSTRDEETGRVAKHDSGRTSLSCPGLRVRNWKTLRQSEVGRDLDPSGPVETGNHNPPVPRRDVGSGSLGSTRRKTKTRTRRNFLRLVVPLGCLALPDTPSRDVGQTAPVRTPVSTPTHVTYGGATVRVVFSTGVAGRPGTGPRSGCLVRVFSDPTKQYVVVHRPVYKGVRGR